MMIGSQIGDGYRIEESLGSGSIGEVFRGCGRDGRQVAIKVLHPLLPEQDGRLFVEVGSRQAAIRSVHVIAIYDVGFIPSGPAYHVMEYVTGEGRDATIRRWLRNNPKPKLRYRVAAAIADGLAVAHAANVVHGDLKPTNILVTPTPDVCPKIGGFGLLMLAETGHGQARTFRFSGAPPYAAPERFGQAGATQASDVYSLGACLFEILTGRLPFEGRTEAEQYEAHVSRMPPSLAELNPEITSSISDLIRAMLAKSSQERPGAAEAAYALRHLADLSVESE